MDPANLVIGLTSGIVGVVVGAIITAMRDRYNVAQTNNGAARVTFFELAQNSAYLQAALKYGVTMPIVTATWSRTAPQVARFLEPEELAVVATAYMKLETTQLAWQGSPTSTVPAAPAATRDVFDRVDAAASILERRGWPTEDERLRLQSQLRDHIAPAEPPLTA